MAHRREHNPSSAAIDDRTFALAINALEGIGLALLTPAGQIVEWSRGAEHILGYSASEATTLEYQDLYPRDEIPPRSASNDLLIALRTHRFDGRRSLTRKDGAPADLALVIAPIRAEDELVAYLVVFRDQSSLSAVPPEPRSRAAMLSALASATSDVVFAKDRDGRYTLLNEAGKRVVKRPLANAIACDDFALFDALSAERIVESDQRIMRTGIAEIYDEDLTVGGIARTFSVTKAPFRDQHGLIAGIVGIARDVTEQKRAEQVLRESERRLSEAERMAHVGYWERHLDADRSNWSDETYRIYGLPPHYGNITSAQSLEMIHPEDRKAVLAAATIALGGGPSMEFEYRVIRPNGEERIVHSKGTVAFDASGQPKSVFGVLQDVTEWREAEKALCASERDLAIAQRVAKIGSWRLDSQLNLLTLSDEAYRVFGIRKADFDGKLTTLISFAHDDDRASLSQAMAPTSPNGKHFAIEFRLPSPTGENRTIRMEGNADLRESGNVGELFGTVQDVSDRNRVQAVRERLHAELVASREKLAILSRRVIDAHESERRKLANELHDDIGQILTVVNLNLEALRFHVTPPGMLRLDESVQVVSQAIGQIRDLSLNLWPASLDLLGLESALSAFLQRHAGRPELSVTFASSLAGRRLPKHIEAVCYRVVQKAWTNVLRHSRATHCSVSVDIRDGFMEVCVRDDGVGFDTAEAWERGKNGMGLGLIGMHEYVTLFGGQLTIVSSIGAGAIVTAKFPLSDDSSNVLSGGSHDADSRRDC